MRWRTKPILVVIGTALLLAAMPGRSQILAPVTGAVGDLTGRISDGAGLDRLDVGRTVGAVRDTVMARLSSLLRANPGQLEADTNGFPVVRGQVVAIEPSPEALAKTRGEGFAVIGGEDIEGAGISTVILGVPKGMPASRALTRLRSMDPDGHYDLNHIYAGAGTVAGSGVGTPSFERAGGRAAQLGLIDSGVAGHPSLAGSAVEQRGFAAGGVVPAAHGTAVASLMVGRTADFQGAAPGQPLIVADVYGSGPTGGSAEALARALGWMAVRKVAVVNVSLVGPPNLLVEKVVGVLVGRGLLIVAAVGNDGPAARPLYPASYPGVIAVTGVDGRNRLLVEAGRARHIDFAAPGADMAAASIKGGYTKVRGTSFAAPLVAGRLAMLAGQSARPVQMLATETVDLGRKGQDAIYGHGLVCGKCRNIVN